MVWLLRFILLCLILFCFYLSVNLFFNPNRKIESARKNKQFLLIDHKEIRKNFLLTYKGVIFVGEKYSNESKEVLSVFIQPQKASALAHLNKEDFLSIEDKIQKEYPNAQVTWGNNINEYLEKHK